MYMTIGILDILLIILIGAVVYFWYKNRYLACPATPSQDPGKAPSASARTPEPFNTKRRRSKRHRGWDLSEILETDPNVTLKPSFVEMQFHNDYRDTMTAFNDIAPSQKEIFNQADLPATYTNPPDSEAEPLVTEFIRQLNRDVKNNIPDHRTSNTGWDEPLPELKETTGWEKQQLALGLCPSLYADPSKRAPVRLIKVDFVEKFTTEFETKLVVTMILQKVNVTDQMVVKVSFVSDNRHAHSEDERRFFRDLETDSRVSVGQGGTVNIVIEEIFVVGYLTDCAVDPGNKQDDFYNFKGLETNDVIDNKTIMKELIKKYKVRNTEDLKFTASLDEEGQAFHNGLRDPTSYDSFQCTRYIMDDLNGEPIVYE